MDKSSAISIKVFKTEIGIGKIGTSPIVKLELLYIQAMWDLTAWMPWRWLSIPFGSVKILVRLL